jgi:hypothetical protein
MSAENSDFDGIVQNEAQQIRAAVEGIVERRALIEQAKGMLMLVYGIEADEAFEMLRGQSQHHNIKLRLIAEQIRGDLVELRMADPPLRQRNATNVLLTAHHRIAAVAARLTDGQSKLGAE